MRTLRSMLWTMAAGFALVRTDAGAAPLYYVSGNWNYPTPTAWSTTPGGAANSGWVQGATAVFPTTVSVAVINNTTALQLGGLTVSEGAKATLTGGSRTFTGAAAITGDLAINAGSGATFKLQTSGGCAGSLSIGGSGVCQILDGGALSADTYLAVGGTLNLAVPAVTVGSLSGSGTIVANAANGNHDLYVDQGTDTVFSGDIAWGGNSSRLVHLHKQGTGSLTLSATPSCPGGQFHARGGILRVAASGSLGNSGTVTINGGTLVYNSSTVPFNRTLSFSHGVLGGTGVVSVAVTVSAGNRIEPGDRTGALTFAGDLTFAAGSTNVWQLGALSESADYDGISVTGGTASLGDGCLALDFALLATDDRPSYADAQPAFWREDRSWTIVRASGAGSISGQFSQISNGTGYANGRAAFTLTGGNGSDVVLHWNAARTLGTVILFM